MKQYKYKLKLIASFLIITSLIMSFGIIGSCEEISDGSIEAAAAEEVKIGSRFHELIFGKKKTPQCQEEIYLCPGGDAFGVRILGGGVSVSKVIDTGSPLCENDLIKSIDGKEIDSIDDVKEALAASGGRDLAFTVRRGSKNLSLTVRPKLCASEYHLGVILKDGTSGIGTVTYYNPKTREFGGLGHGISFGDGKDIVKMTEGVVTGVILAGASRGEVNRPGELRGVLTDKKIGELYANTECGVFGTLDSALECTLDAPIPIAHKNEVKKGEATVLTTVKSGKRAAYTIEIDDIDYSSDSTKSFKVHVTDESLIALTGGIVRGMSGSPIIQNGKLVGAVTHVLINDPTTGYGIFIENMLNAAQNQVIPKAA